MIVLSCSNISKSFGINSILEDISFTIADGDKIGLIGLNGSGKTTLFNILAGQIYKDEGNIYRKKDLKIGYLKQHTSIDSQLTVYEECLEVFQDLIEMEEEIRKLEVKISDISQEGQSEELDSLLQDYSNLLDKFNNENGYGYKSEIKGILKGLGFREEDLDKDSAILSGGQKSRLSLAKLLLEKPDILLLDEPTNHLDIEAINWLEDFLNEYDKAVLLISHDRYFLNNVVSKIFLLENKNIEIYNSSYSKYMEQRKKDLEILRSQYENQQREIKRQEEIIERFSNYGDRRYIKQAQSRQKLLDRMRLVDRPLDEKTVKISFEPRIKSGRDVLMVEDLGKSFGDYRLFENIDFNIYRGEKVGLIGPNGIGKTTLFKAILEEIPYEEGKVNLGHNVHMAYFDQEQTSLNLDKTIIDEIWDDNPKLSHYEIRTILSRFLFIGDDIFQEISDLSGGERGRLQLLKMMLSDSNFLLMDEPTNHLDIDSKEVLEDALRDYDGTILVISHDRYFLNRVTDKILEMTDEGISEYLGNYDYYLEKKNEVLVEEEEDYKTKTQIRLERQKAREKENIERRKRKEIAKLEKEISQKEILLEDLDQELCQPDLYDQPKKAIKLSQDRDGLQEKLDMLYNQWIILTED